MTRKTKRVEFHFDERTLVTDDGVMTEYLSDLRKYTQAVDVMREFESNMLKMAGEIVQLRTRIDALMKVIAKDDPMRRIYDDEGIPVLVCMWCGATRQRFENEVKHADSCVWKLTQAKPDN